MSTIIETERIILRRFLIEDDEAVLELNSSAAVQKYTGDMIIDTIEEARAIITDIWFKEYAAYGYGRFAVIFKPENKVIGFAGLKYLPAIEETDIGFRILPAYWGKGVISEIAGELVTYGFDILGLNKIIATVMPANIASIRVVEKAGLIYERTSPYGSRGDVYNFYSISMKD